MKPIWLIERDTFNDDNPKKMAEIVRELGMEAIWFRYPGFDAGLDVDYDKFPDPKEEAFVIVYGSINAAMYLQRNRPWIPGVWCDFKALRCSNYLSYWGEHSVQQNFTLLPLSEVYRKKDWLYQVYGQQRKLFIRPDDNAKSFHGEIVAEPQFDHWYEVANFYNPGKNCLTLVSTPQKIESEYRFVIADKKVITGSQYRLNGKLENAPIFPDEAASLAEEVANSCEFNPHPIYVMDICKTEWGEWWLLEIGSVNCAGLYACDLRKVVEKASEIALAEWKDLQ